MVAHVVHPKTNYPRKKQSVVAAAVGGRERRRVLVEEQRKHAEDAAHDDAQRATASATRVHALGGALGIIVGCICGMFPLLFYEDPTPFPTYESGGDD